MKNVDIAEKLYKLEVPYWMKKAGLGVVTGAWLLALRAVSQTNQKMIPRLSHAARVIPNGTK